MKSKSPLRATATIFYTDNGGRLANQLFSHAHLLAFCLENSPMFSLFNHSITRYREFLKPGAEAFGRPSPSFVFMLRMALSRWSTGLIARLVLPTVANPQDIDLHSQRRCVLRGWEGGENALLHKHRAYVTERLALRHNESAVGQILSDARSQSELLIGVHIRHGDFRSFDGGRFFLPTSEYATAMSVIAATRKVSFLVCSDEPRSKDEFPDLDVTISSCTSPADDITLLSRCDVVVGCHSTFAAWAAFAGNVPLLPLERGMPAADIRRAAARFL